MSHDQQPPLIWFQLVDSDGQPYKESSVSSVSLNPSAVFDELRQAVIDANPDLLSGLDASQLKIYKNKTAFDGKEEALKDNCPVSGLGLSDKEALVVLVSTPTVSNCTPTRFISLVLGENQDKRVMTLMLIPSAAFTAFILLSYSINWKTITTAILAFDIFAGLLSNQQEKTHQAWKKQARPYLIAFVVVHSTIYPSLLVLLQVSLPLMMLMLAMLFTKTLGFIIGTRLFHQQ
mmetsp:Transcript_1743/g.2661  ORF Transcript_1743/g.2661 Transcript_1743/m.2661 type:complete len:233 (-) Transcript_1743:4883-5581(-)